MYPSYVFGRSGGLDETTGLFVLEGGLTDFDLSVQTVNDVGGSRDGYEVGSKIPFQDNHAGGSKLNFFNKLPRYVTNEVDFGEELKECIAPMQKDWDTFGPGVLFSIPDSIIFNKDTRKISSRRYVSEFVGIIPQTRVIKTILRQKDIATKRIILFGSCLDPVAGGGLWLVSPHGFPWKDTPKSILDEGTPEDVDRALSDRNFLFFAMTGAVPFISGHRQRQPDEEFPRILRIPSIHPDYTTLLGDRLATEIVPKQMPKPKSNLGFVTELFGKAQANGKVATKPSDLISDDAISLTDSDILL
jgi:hypothetical protein